MDITLEELYTGKPTVIKGKTYYGTEAYVKPFVERLKEKTDDFRVHIQLPDQYTITDDGKVRTEDLTYNRVYIEAVMPDNKLFENHDKVIGMVMGLDVRKPVAKFFAGSLNSACTNLCVFSPTYLAIQQIEEGQPLDFLPLDNIIQKEDETLEHLAIMNSIVWPNNPYQRERLLGKWIDNSILFQYNDDFQKVKIGTDAIIRAYKSMFFDENSEYYIRDNTFTNMNAYNALTQQITNERDKGKVFSLPEKTILCGRIIDVSPES